jgi:protein-S-isoprenylcysteine O-methyltransferase Ste14
MSDQPADNPGVITWPPLIAIGALLIGVAADWLAPLRFVSRAGLPLRGVVAALVFVLGGWIALRAKGVFDAAGTNVEPWKPATALATSGVYARSRNPMYVGTWVMAVGLALGFASDWGMLLLIPALAVLHYGVVLREERYLTAKFGEPYRDYLARVPRYGWPL